MAEGSDLGYRCVLFDSHVLFSFLIKKKVGCAGSSLLCAGFSSCIKGPSLVAVHGFLIAVVSLVTEHGLWGTWAQ